MGTSHEPVITVFAMCAGSIMAFTYNFVSFKFIQMTSSVTHAIAGNLKLFAVVVLPAMFIDHITSLTSWIGFGIFLCAALGYAILEQKNMRTPSPPATTSPTDKLISGAPSDRRRSGRERRRRGGSSNLRLPKTNQLSGMSIRNLVYSPTDGKSVKRLTVFYQRLSVC